ncbi:response regulator [Salinibaculum salinum]|uniref:response regulator n=1 Tax=Salinibaculum salinum TaxID=3131996 RepID=UPI0030ED4F15
MGVNGTTHGSEHVVELSRQTLRGSRRALQENPPLVRGGTSQSLETDLIEIPLPVASGEEGQDVRVLHVDDDPDLGELAKTCLERIDEDITVTTETNVVQALDHLNNGKIDCIISDYDMPNTNGIEFLEIVREQYPDLPFILFTGKGSEEVASEAIAAGVTDYMQKGGGLDQYEVLANRVQNAVDRYRTQQQFWDSLSWYRRLVEQDLTGVFIIQDGEFVYVNERLADIFGYTQSELVGEYPLEIASETDDDGFRELVELDHDEVETFQYEFTGERADGTKLSIEVQGGSIQYDGDPGCIGILWDKTE